MSCFYHSVRESVSKCSKCGRFLCEECASTFEPPTCFECAAEHIEDVKKEMFTSIAISVALMIVGMVFIKSPSGFLLAGIPYGWSILNRITPSMFLWMSWFGWLIYYLIKLFLAYIIGIIALPIKLYKWISELIRVNKLQDIIDKNGI